MAACHVKGLVLLRLCGALWRRLTCPEPCSAAQECLNWCHTRCRGLSIEDWCQWLCCRRAVPDLWCMSTGQPCRTRSQPYIHSHTEYKTPQLHRLCQSGTYTAVVSQFVCVNHNGSPLCPFSSRTSCCSPQAQHCAPSVQAPIACACICTGKCSINSAEWSPKQIHVQHASEPQARYLWLPLTLPSGARAAAGTNHRQCPINIQPHCCTRLRSAGEPMQPDLCKIQNAQCHDSACG
jgi:hypothetical protein